MRAELIELTTTSDVPVLSDGVITLRAHQTDDVERVVGYATDPLTMRWAKMPSPYGRSDAERFIIGALQGWRDGKSMIWAIEHEGRFIGSMDLRGSGRIVDMGFGLHPDARGLGLVRRAMVRRRSRLMRCTLLTPVRMRRPWRWTCPTGTSPCRYSPAPRP